MPGLRQQKYLARFSEKNSQWGFGEQPHMAGYVKEKLFG